MLFFHLGIYSMGEVKFEMKFMSCRENGSKIARGIAKCNFAVFATTSEIYPNISLLLELSQINTIASFITVKISSNSLPQ